MKEFESWDVGDKDYSCTVSGHQDKHGNYHVDKIKYHKPIHCFGEKHTHIYDPIKQKLEELERRVKKLEQEGSYFTRAENIKEVRNLNGC